MNKDLTAKPWRAGLMLIVGKKPLEKTAAEETRIIEYTPEGLSKEILTLWKQVDGPLQNFFDAFTVNKTSNDMKIKISDILKEWGYDVTPTLIDETPRYASFKMIKKASTSKDAKTFISYYKKILPKSKLIIAIDDKINRMNRELQKEAISDLMNYYKLIFPDSYAESLINVGLEQTNVTFEEFKDIQISDESLTQMERMDSGNQKPTSNKPNDGGVNGWDFTTQTQNGPGGPAPNMYETRANLKKK